MKTELSTVLLTLFFAAVAAGVDGFEVRHSFNGGTGTPVDGLVQVDDGSSYGMTRSGGAHGYGTVFRRDPDGTLATLHNFDWYDGSYLNGPLVQGPDGNLYGTTYGGGYGYGTVFRMTPQGSLTTLYRFDAPDDGYSPEAGLVQANGRFYGTTAFSHQAGVFGTVFWVDGAGGYGKIHDFTGPDGARPRAAMVRASNGKLYGTTASGGGGQGTIFQLDPSSNSVTALFTFSGENGSSPRAALVQHSNGFLYGTTELGGADYFGGTVFKVDLDGAHTLLHSFVPFVGGLNPTAPLVEAPNGDLYGTTSSGGLEGRGVVFRVDSSSGTVAEPYVHSFSVAQGGDASGLILAADGAFYGTTPSGGGGGVGTVFRLEVDGAFDVVEDFALTEGSTPASALVEGCDGALYGTTYFGGSGGGGGTVFRIDAANAIASFHDFGPDPASGQYPRGSLVRVPDCSLWGTTEAGGAFGYGTVYRIDPAGLFTLLHSFDGSDGVAPHSGLIHADDGLLYGTTYAGGEYGGGTVYRISLAGVFETRYSFDLPEGHYPAAGLLQATDGLFYGTTSEGGNGTGTIFHMDVAGAITHIHSFEATPFVIARESGVIQGSDGLLYGTSPIDGPDHYGSVFKVETTGESFTTLHNFTGGADGGAPAAALIEGSDGSFYGTTTANGGSVFRLSPSGIITPLHRFTGDDGGSPHAALMQTADGRLNGTAAGGGSGNRGVVFRQGTSNVLDLSSIVPASGLAASGWYVRANGNGFIEGETTLMIGGLPATGIDVLSTTQVAGLSPTLLPGTLNDVTVGIPALAPAASATLSDAFFADFLDVPQSDIFHDYVESVFRAGITAGCGGGSYCRNNPVTRAQMAVFLLKAKHGAAYTPPECNGTFDDVPCPSQFADWVEQLATEGITGGCGGNYYCPGGPVTRAQMAVFLLKTEHGSSHVPPPCGGIFGDLSCPSLFADWIEELYDENVTGGCQASPLLYCPESSSTRGQMAVFLVKTFGLAF